MKQAFSLAKLGGKNVKTNPNVGCVIVHNNTIIGEGFHQVYGGHHAEVNAIESVKPEDRNLLKSSTIYVSLEPCCIQNKTPACTNLILASKIPKVVISAIDPNPLVSGNGVNILREHGVEVITGILEDQGIELISPFLAQLSKKPYIILKWAKSADNFIGHISERLLISTKYASIYTHDLRSKVDGILVGKQTVLTDNPSLNTRHVDGMNPVRIVLDSMLSIDSSYKIFSETGTLIIVNNLINKTVKKHHYIKVSDTHNIPEVIEKLFHFGINNLLVEGGASVLNSFIKSATWDHAHIITSSKKLLRKHTAENLVNAPSLHGTLVQNLQIDTDLIQIVSNKKS